jgi:hypothetical protein
MPIEGPLRELGLQDVFQLLDLSRKTGMLRVTSQLRDDEGHVYFDGGRVVQAQLRSKPSPAIDPAAISERELERRLRGQVEAAVFDLMSWREGFFSFEERDVRDIAANARVRIATESLLMESARRIDEWSRIADKIPDLGVVPELAEVKEDHESQLDLLPHEWEVLSLIDGERDVGTIARLHGHPEFETAKVVYGLVTTGVVEIPPTRRASVAEAVEGIPLSSPAGAQPAIPVKPPVNPAIAASLERGFTAARLGDLSVACEHWKHFLELAPTHTAAARVRAALEAATALRAAIESHATENRNG